jgi:hypothetical protein
VSAPSRSPSVTTHTPSQSSGGRRPSTSTGSRPRR